VPQHETLFKVTAVLKVFPFSQVYLGQYSADKRWNRKAIGALVTNERKQKLLCCIVRSERKQKRWNRCAVVQSIEMSASKKPRKFSSYWKAESCIYLSLFLPFLQSFKNNCHAEARSILFHRLQMLRASA